MAYFKEILMKAENTLEISNIKALKVQHDIAHSSTHGVELVRVSKDRND